MGTPASESATPALPSEPASSWPPPAACPYAVDSLEADIEALSLDGGGPENVEPAGPASSKAAAPPPTAQNCATLTYAAVSSLYGGDAGVKRYIVTRNYESRGSSCLLVKKTFDVDFEMSADDPEPSFSLRELFEALSADMDADTATKGEPSGEDASAWLVSLAAARICAGGGDTSGAREAALRRLLLPLAKDECADFERPSTRALLERLDTTRCVVHAFDFERVENECAARTVGFRTNVQAAMCRLVAAVEAAAEATASALTASALTASALTAPVSPIEAARAGRLEPHLADSIVGVPRGPGSDCLAAAKPLERLDGGGNTTAAPVGSVRPRYGAEHGFVRAFSDMTPERLMQGTFALAPSRSGGDDAAASDAPSEQFLLFPETLALGLFIKVNAERLAGGELRHVRARQEVENDLKELRDAERDAEARARAEAEIAKKAAPAGENAPAPAPAPAPVPKPAYKPPRKVFLRVPRSVAERAAKELCDAHAVPWSDPLDVRVGVKSIIGGPFDASDAGKHARARFSLWYTLVPREDAIAKNDVWTVEGSAGFYTLGGERTLDESKRQPVCTQ